MNDLSNILIGNISVNDCGGRGFDSTVNISGLMLRPVVAQIVIPTRGDKMFT